MKDINLLPKIVKPKNIVQIFLNILIIILIIILLALSGLTFLFNNSKQTLMAKFDKLEKTNFQLKTYNDKLQGYKEFEDNLNYKSKLVSGVKEYDVIWSKKFYDLSKVIPDNVYLINIQAKADNLYSLIEQAKSGNLTAESKIVAFVIDGYSTNYLSISKFIIGLKGIPEITDPWVTSINDEVVNNIKLLKFNIVAYWDTSLFLKNIKVQQQSNNNQNVNTNINTGSSTTQSSEQTINNLLK